MKSTKPSIRLSEEELSTLQRASEICAIIRDDCPDLDFPCQNFTTYADNASECLDSLVEMYYDHINEES